MEQVNATSGPRYAAASSSLPESGGAAASKPAAPGRPQDPKLWKAATEFQEVMLSQFTQAMRTSDSDNTLFEQCPGRETFDQMFSDAIAHQMSASGALGLNKSIYRAMGGTYEKGSAAAPLPAQAAPGPGLGSIRSSAAQGLRALTARAVPMSPRLTAHDVTPHPASNGGAAIHLETAE